MNEAAAATPSLTAGRPGRCHRPPVWTGAAVIAIALAGCAPTLRQVRDEPPARVGMTRGTYRALADCVATGLRKRPEPFMAFAHALVYEVVDQPGVNQARVTGRSALAKVYSLFPADYIVIDLTFVQRPGDEVAIESRWGGPGRSGGRYMDRYVWPIAAQCAGIPVNVTPEEQ